MKPIHACIALSLALLGGLASALAFAQAPALASPPKTGKDRQANAAVVLTVSGRITQHNAPQQYRWSMAMLEALPQHSFTTMTPWAQQPLQFSGPLLRDVLQTVGAQGQRLVAEDLGSIPSR